MASTSLGSVSLVKGQVQTAVAGEAIGVGDAVALAAGKCVKATLLDATKGTAVGIALASTTEDFQCVYAGVNSVIQSASATNATQDTIWYVG